MICIFAVENNNTNNISRNANTSDNADVQVWERDNEKGVITFYITYSQNGKQQKERLYNVPRVNKTKERVLYRDCRKRAEAIAAERQTEIRNRMLGINNTSLLLKDWFDVLIERYAKNESEVSNRSTNSKGFQIVRDLLIEYAGERVRLVDVDKAFVRGYVDFLKERYSNTGTAQQKYKKLNTALHLAVQEELIGSNPCDRMSRGEKIKVEEKEREYLSEEELRRMIETPCGSEKTRQVFLFMCYCGLRISDVKQLKWGDVYKETVDGEERLGVNIRVQKTQKPLKFRLSRAAVECLPERGEKDDNDRVFDLLTEPSMNRSLKRWAEASGVKKNVTLHTGRHTFATMAISRGVDLYVVCNLLGHSDVRVTQVYAKVEQRKMDEVAELFDDELREGGAE